MALGGSGLGAGWLAGLEPYRPYFMGLSVITLGVGFWTAYKKPHSCHSCGECQSDVHAKRRARIGSMWAVAAMSVSLFIVAEINDAQHPHDLDGASFAQEQDQVFND